MAQSLRVRFHRVGTRVRVSGRVSANVTVVIRVSLISPICLRLRDCFWFLLRLKVNMGVRGFRLGQRVRMKVRMGRVVRGRWWLAVKVRVRLLIRRCDHSMRAWWRNFRD